MMSSTALGSRYAISAPDVVAEDFNGQVVILNLSDGRYFSLGGIAPSVWTNLLDGKTPQAILDSVAGQRPELGEETARFVERLVDLRLITPQDAAGSDFSSIVTETWDGAPPSIEVYDDLAELIFADPIHDVDEQAGWPTPRPAE
jgi:hypothetical protein